MSNLPAYEYGKKSMRHRAALAEGFARQILETAGPFLTRPASELDVLDLGCGYGFTTVELARRCRRAVGIEPNSALYEAALNLREDRGLANLEFRRATAADLDERETYDLVVLDNVLEHIVHQGAALATACAALKQRGVLLVIVPNKLWPMEVHYDLPLLSYLPLRWANWYLRLSGRGTDYTDASYAPTWFRLRRLFAARAELSYQFVVPADLSLATLGDSLHYRFGAAALRRFPCLWVFSKMFVVVAVKR
ncbi:MAG TPA: class I SAM-dependent methyltransferase [Pirellulales bacterium]